MPTSTISLGVDEGLANGRVFEHVGDLKQPLGLLGFKRREAFVEFVRGLVEFGRSFGAQDLPALHTERRVTLVFSAAGGALNRGDLIRFFLRHVFAVEPGTGDSGKCRDEAYRQVIVTSASERGVKVGDFVDVEITAHEAMYCFGTPI